MADLTSLDGSFEKTLTGSNAIKDLPSIVQKYMMAGVSNNKLTFTKLFDEKAVIDNGGLVNVVAQLAMLDEKQQSAFLSLSKLDEKVKDTIKDLLQATKQGELFNSKLFEQEASKEDNISKGVLNEVMQAAGMKDTDGNYLLTNTKDVCDLLEQYANDANNAQKAQELFNAGLLEQSDNGYKVSASLLKLIGAKKSDIVITGIATAGQMAWNYAMQIGKQLLLSLGVAAVAFITTKLVDYIMNLKTRSEELVDAMNNSHDAAQQATKDVEEIQSKIDELNKSLKDAGVDKIEDIVDPTERERLQAINDMLQAQLELKKQLEKDANDKANVQKTMEQAWADTSKDTQKLMYDMRACFDNSWSMNEAGVTHLADMTEQTIGGAYDEITSDAANTFGNGGSLPTETDNAWANVEPGAKDVNTNLTWMMDQSYNAIKAGCEAAVTSIKNDLATTGDAFEAVGKKAADTSTAISEASQKAQQSTQKNTGSSKGVTAAAGAGIGAAVGSFLGPLGAIGGAAIGGFFGSLFGHANGLKSAKFPHMANVDEQGPEMLVRQPQSGRYTYLETGDGVVPADITSRLFEMGGNPDAWFQKQMAKYGSQPIVQGGGGDVITSIGDIIITNPVGSSDALANEIKQKLPTKVAQMQSKR